MGQMEVVVKNSQETEELARLIGLSAQAGDVLILSGDLGAGKTTLTKGIALGLGITQMIKSPTYTIVREYPNGRLPLYHMDVYRVAGETADLALDEYFESDGLSVVEWGELLEEELPESYVFLRLQRHPDDENQRTISIEGKGQAGLAFFNRIVAQIKQEEKDG